MRPTWCCPDDRVRLTRHEAGRLRALRRAGYRPLRRAGLRGGGGAREGLDLPLLQRAARPLRRPRGPRGAGAAPPGHGDRRHGLLPPGAARRSAIRGRSCRLRGGDRRDEYRLVGGLGDPVVVCEPLRGVRRRRAAGLFVGRDDSPPYAQVGEVDTLDGFLLVLSPWTVRNVRFDEEARASSTATTSTSASRCARQAARSSRPTSGRSITARSRCCRTGSAGWRRTSGSRRSGTAACRASGRAGQLGGAGAAGRGGARRGADARPTRRSWSCRRAGSRCERALEEARGSISWRLTAPASPARAAVIVFASAMTDPEAYRRYARPGIQMAAEPDSKIHAFAAWARCAGATTCCSTRAALEPGLEALVLVAAGRGDPGSGFCARCRRALERSAGGCRGPCRARPACAGIAWWEGAISAARSYSATSASEAARSRAFSWKRHDPAPAEVDVVDGRLMVLSPWAVRDASLRRVAQPGLRLRARPVPEGAGRRTQGDDGRSARGVPDPVAQGAHRTPTSGSRGTSRRARGSRTGFQRRPPARGAGRSARAAPRPSARQLARSPIPRSTRWTRRWRRWSEPWTELTESVVLEADRRRSARLNSWRRRPALGRRLKGSVAERPADLVLRDHDCAGAMPARTRRRDRRSATAKALDSSMRRNRPSCRAWRSWSLQISAWRACERARW